MLYAIIARDIPASQERRLASRPAHLARLEQLKEEGRLVLAGPHPAIDSNDPGAAGFTGSLIVAEFDSPGRGAELGRGRSLPGRRGVRRGGGQAVQESPALRQSPGTGGRPGRPPGKRFRTGRRFPVPAAAQPGRPGAFAKPEGRTGRQCNPSLHRYKES